MAEAVALKMGYDEQQILELKRQIVDVLITSSKYKEAGDLLSQLPELGGAKSKISMTVELYCKANTFMSGVRESMKEVDMSLRQKYLNQVRSTVNLAYDVKKN